jgi:hypothetical protein
MECQKTTHLENCTCTADGCPQHHLAHRQFPRCVFPAEMDVSDRSFDAFAEALAAGQV